MHIAAESHVVCGSCYYCLNQLPHICQEITTIGFDRPGGFAEYVAIPAENAVLKPPSITDDVAALLEPFGNALDTTLCVDLVGKSVLVTGCGPQGLMAIAITNDQKETLAIEGFGWSRALGKPVVVRFGRRMCFEESTHLEPIGRICPAAVIEDAIEPIESDHFVGQVCTLSGIPFDADFAPPPLKRMSKASTGLH